MLKIFFEKMLQKNLTFSGGDSGENSDGEGGE